MAEHGQLSDPADTTRVPQIKSAFALGPWYSNVVAWKSERAGVKMNELLTSKREQILRLAATHGARNVRIFGSAARGEAGAESDLDLLVEMEQGRSLLDLVGFWQDLEELLGRRVDVITDGGVSPYLRDRIYAEAIPL